MRRILTIVLISSLLTALGAGVAAARLDGDGARASDRSTAPFELPVAAPTADPIHDGAYSYRSSTKLAAAMQGEVAAASSTSDGSGAGAAATVTVTATVLPTATISLDNAGGVDEIIVNTPERGAADVIYLIRDADGEPRATLGADTWLIVRDALRRTSAGTGVVYAG